MNLRMPETGNSIKPDISILDDSVRFNPDQSFDLALQLDADGLSFSILDKKRNCFCALVKYSFGKYSTEEKKEEAISIILAEDPILNDIRFNDVSLSYGNSPAALVPEAVFNPDDSRKYLSFNQHVSEGTEIYIDKLKAAEAVNVFSVEDQIISLIKEKFSQIKIHHRSSGLIESLLFQYRSESSKIAIVNIGQKQFELVVTQGKDLVYYNSFNYQTPEDVIYHILFVCEQMDMNPTSFSLMLTGEINRHASIYELITRYIKNVKFSERNPAFDYSFSLKEIPSHSSYSLFAQGLCV